MKETRELAEEIDKYVDALGINFPVGQLKSQEKFACGSVTFYLDLFTLDLKAKTKIDLLKEFVLMFTASGIVKDGKQYFKNLLYREALGSTAIGQGIAIPYTSADIDETMVAGVAISKEGIDFDSLDGKPVQIFFVSAFKMNPESPGGVHLKFLARVSRLLKNPEMRQALIDAKSKEELFQFIKDNFKP
jgi:PTS system fructose-specific IIC component